MQDEKLCRYSKNNNNLEISYQRAFVKMKVC